LDSGFFRYQLSATVKKLLNCNSACRHPDQKKNNNKDDDWQKDVNDYLEKIFKNLE